jgi:hypothetical protein
VGIEAAECVPKPHEISMERRRPIHDFFLSFQPYMRQRRRLRRRLLLAILVIGAASLPVGLALLLTR